MLSTNKKSASLKQGWPAGFDDRKTTILAVAAVAVAAALECLIPAAHSCLA